MVEFKDWIKYMLDHKDSSYLSEINYYDLVKRYCELFGKDQVFIFLFEEFVQNKRQFIDRLSSSLGIDPHLSYKLVYQQHELRGPSKREFRYMKFKSKYLLGFQPEKHLTTGRFIDGLILRFFKKGGKPAIPIHHWEKEIFELFHTGNKKLSETFNLQLDKYNYPM